MSQKSPKSEGKPEFVEEISSLLNDPEMIKEAADKASDVAADYIRKHPFQTVGASFALGLLAGIFIGKKTN